MCIKDMGASKIPEIVNIFMAVYEVYWRSQHSPPPPRGTRQRCIGGNIVQEIWFRKVYKAFTKTAGQPSGQRFPGCRPCPPCPRFRPICRCIPSGDRLGPRDPGCHIGCRLGAIIGNFQALCKLKQNFTKFFVRTTCCFWKNFVIFVQQEAGTVPGVTGMTD